MPELWKLEERVTYALRDLYQKYGYSQFKMSKFEAYDLYMQNKEFLVSDAIITFTDTDGKLMALKPDVTLSIVKNFRKDKTPVQKVCYNENVYRIAGASKQFREIMQTGLECMGNIGNYEVCEVLSLAVQSLQTISDRFVLELSHMDIWTNLLSELSLTETQTAEIITYISQKNEDALLDMLSLEDAQKLLRIMKISGPILPALKELVGYVDNGAFQDLKRMAEFLERSGLPCNQIHLDFSIVSDRNYYNGIVFRGYVEGIPTHVLAGGQYDRLMDKMEKAAKAIGFAVYLDQLELLDRSRKEYDVDTVVLYSHSESPVTILKMTQNLTKQSMLVLPEKPLRLRYRQLLQIKDGRMEVIENNG